ncbi:hypothetical protein KHS38_18270 [Mucilaginibacter sp. Bleaf8]|uniref:hypothetical protein n=1 Tax=Mucilaginibacter sp. Bleaf8 TaxID=2834430 RepID=UPI001BCE3BD6|nr:hypothetical protein [Mucilaginibacter sp. Bleaf8]MBS7566360.1 hypothetical protein [Mucilaginibacter sp. Bleaf8]
MQKAYLILICTLLTSLAFAQKKTAVPATATLDVDRLYQKYKNQNHIIIQAGNRDVRANVVIQYNIYKQLSAIILYGETPADISDAMDDLKSELENAKQKAGYKPVSGRNLIANFERNDTYQNNIPVSVWQKGTQYAKYGIKKADEGQPVIDTTNTEATPAPRYTANFFYFEVGDSARKQAARHDKLEF